MICKSSLKEINTSKAHTDMSYPKYYYYYLIRKKSDSRNKFYKVKLNKRKHIIITAVRNNISAS